MSVYGYLFCRWIWLYLSQKVALVFLLQPVWQYVFLLCATSPFPKINSLFPPLPPPLPSCLSSIFLSLHFMVGSISIPPECLSLSVLCSLSCFSSTWPPWQGAGGLIELCLSVRFGTEAAHLPASTGQLSPFLLGWKGPSVTDNLPVREGETEEMREGVLSLSPFPSSLPVSFVIDFSCPVSFSSPFFELFSWSLFLFITLSVIPFLLLYSDNNGLNLDHWTEIKAFFSTFIYPGKVSWAQIRYSWLWP